MVFLNDKKYACETCIKGHRSSSCQHTDRPLFEIKKKGRPVTQCEHCRELRKTKQVHVKCLCESREDVEVEPSHSIPAKKANRAGVVVSAAFPNGLPGSPSSSSPTPAESSSHVDGLAQRTAVPCTCKVGGSCQCCTPRRPQKASREDRSGGTVSRMNTPPKSRPPRPIAPGRTSLSDMLGGVDYLASVSTSSPSSDISPSQSQRRGVSSRSTHGSVSYSPYTSTHDHPAGNATPEQYLPTDLIASMQALGVPQNFGTLPNSPVPSLTLPQTRSPSGSPGQWMEDGPGAAMTYWKEFCQCSDNCACPGCFQHNNDVRVQPSPQTCAKPERCQSCFSCTAVSMLRSDMEGPFALDPGFDPATLDAGFGTNMNTQTFFNDAPPNAGGPQDVLSSHMSILPQNMGSTSNINDPMLYGSPSFTIPARCLRCPPGQCSCLPNQCNCDHNEEAMLTRDRSLTFATSGERASCCGSGGGSSDSSRSQSYSSGLGGGTSMSTSQRSQSGGSSYTMHEGHAGMPGAPQGFLYDESVLAPFPVTLSAMASPPFPRFGGMTASTYFDATDISMGTMRTPSTDSQSSCSGSSSVGGSRRGSASDSSTSGSGRRLVRAILPKGPVVFPEYG